MITVKIVPPSMVFVLSVRYSDFSSGWQGRSRKELFIFVVKLNSTAPPVPHTMPESGTPSLGREQGSGWHRPVLVVGASARLGDHSGQTQRTDLVR